MPEPGSTFSGPDPAAAVVVGDPGVVGEPEDAARGIEEVGDRAVRAEQAGGLLERVVEDRLVLGRDEVRLGASPASSSGRGGVGAATSGEPLPGRGGDAPRRTAARPAFGGHGRRCPRGGIRSRDRAPDRRTLVRHLSRSGVVGRPAATASRDDAVGRAQRPAAIVDRSRRPGTRSAARRCDPTPMKPANQTPSIHQRYRAAMTPAAACARSTWSSGSRSSA